MDMLKEEKATGLSGTINFSLEYPKRQFPVEIKLDLKKKSLVLNQQELELVSQPCNYGGFTHYILCPKCSNRCTVLYSRDTNKWLCRHCSGMQKKKINRSKTDCCYYWELALKQAKKVDPTYTIPIYGGYGRMVFPDKAPGMRWKTYHKLRYKFMQYKSEGDRLWFASLGSLIK